MSARSKPSRQATKSTTKSGKSLKRRQTNKKLNHSAVLPGVAEATQAAYGANEHGRQNGQLVLGNGLDASRTIPEAQPFLKWVGGKAQMINQFNRLFPNQINRYIEPFVGGGAVFFHLKHRFPQMNAQLGDINEQLINTYLAVRDFPHELIARLDEHLAHYNRDRNRYYYSVRSQHHLPRNEVVERAARMIFLNKTCFNGLWRVNARGEFNVPIGSHKNPALYDRRNILAASAALKGVVLIIRDFRDTLAQTRAGDFVYIDPPYAPLSKTANFTSYAKEDFGRAEQQELAALFADAAQRGVRMMLSNSDLPFVRGLYNGFTIHTVSARRAINRDGAKRGAVNEVLVCAGGQPQCRC